MILNRYIWKNRILIIFAPSAAAEEYRALTKDINLNVAELEEKEIIVVNILENGNSFLGEILLQKDVAQNLREQYQVKKGESCILLLGKNGIELLREYQQVTVKDIFDALNQMLHRTSLQ